ncbi:MAG: FHA domain-containing protein [Acidobacteriota bacterium]
MKPTCGPDRGKRFKLTKPAIAIGRGGGRQNDITLSDSTVSREHAQILFSASEMTIQLINDSTTNPARLNGGPVDKFVLKDGDIIQLGASVLQFKRS